MVWTIGCPNGTATVSEKVTVEAPDDWSLYVSVSGDLCAENKCGTYLVNDILVPGGCAGVC